MNWLLAGFEYYGTTWSGSGNSIGKVEQFIVSYHLLGLV